MKYILHSEGKYQFSGATGQYQYDIKDHLGNVRLVVDGSGTELQQSAYYPFGMQYMAGGNADNKYLYNGKELQDDAIGGGNLDWYDYGARMYDPALGRWHAVDPLAEKYPNIGAFVYCNDNPVRFIDPDGNEVGDPESGGTPARLDKNTGLVTAQSTIRTTIDPEMPKYNQPDKEEIEKIIRETIPFGISFSEGSGSCGTDAEEGSDYLGSIKEFMGLLNKFGNKGLSGSEFGDLLTAFQALADYEEILGNDNIDFSLDENSLVTGVLMDRSGNDFELIQRKYPWDQKQLPDGSIVNFVDSTKYVYIFLNKNNHTYKTDTVDVSNKN